MRDPRTLDEFAAAMEVPRDEIERFKNAGLLDTDDDDAFDELDALRLHVLLTHLDRGGTIDDFARSLRDASPANARLFEKAHTHTTAEAAELVGFEPEKVRALGNALGLPQTDRVDHGDVEMLRLAKTMLDAGMPWEAFLDGARVYADSLRRICETNLQLTHQNFCEPLAQAGHNEPSIATAVSDAVGVFGPTSEALMISLYRKYIADAALEHAATHLQPRDPAAPRGSMRATIVFIDVALFSTYADLHGDVAAVELVDRFDRSVRESATRHYGRIVKQIGDEFMLVFRQSSDAVRFAAELNDAMGRIDRDVAPRTGIHDGLVLYRLGDYYGTAVNIAARIASMALPNSILVTEPVAKAAAGEGFEVAELGVRSLRGMEEPLPIYRVLTNAREE